MDPPSRKRKSKAKSSANRTVDTVQDTFEVPIEYGPVSN